MNFLSRHKYLFAIWVVMVIVAIYSGIEFYGPSLEPAQPPNLSSAPSFISPTTTERVDISISNADPKVSSTLDTPTTTNIPGAGATSSAPKAPPNEQSPSSTAKFILKIENSDFMVSLPENSTAYDLMKTARDKKIIDFTAKEFPGMGFFIESINNKPNNNNNQIYWIYYINGKKATIGVSTYILKKGDIITWKYEKEIL